MHNITYITLHTCYIYLSVKTVAQNQDPYTRDVSLKYITSNNEQQLRSAILLGTLRPLEIYATRTLRIIQISSGQNTPSDITERKKQTNKRQRDAETIVFELDPFNQTFQSEENPR